MDIRISVLQSGAVLLEGKEVTLAELDQRLAVADRKQDRVLYHRENTTGEAPPQAKEVIGLVVKYSLRIGLSKTADFSEHVRPERPVSFDGIFSQARDLLAQVPGGRGLVMIGVDGRVGVLPAPPPSAKMSAMIPRLPGMAPGQLARIAVIANAREAWPPGTQPDVQQVAKAIPFAGNLIGLGYDGHFVYVFSGHWAALSTGLKDAEFLIVDAGIIPSLQKDWMTVAQAAMTEPRKVFVARENNALIPAVPASNEQGWDYTEPDGEASYANCLLTTLGHAGSGASAKLTKGRQVPELAPLTKDPDQLEWIGRLPFQYDRLDAGKVIEVLRRARQDRPGPLSALGLGAQEWLFSALVVTKAGKDQKTFEMKLEWGKTLTIRVI